ncbi:MAG: tetratricopeptide repeat protein [Bauldia sp.]
MSRQSFFIASAFAFVLAAGTAPALAAGGGGNTDASLQCGEGLVPDAQNQMCVPCEQGTIYDKETKTCVARSSELIDERDLYLTGRELALAGRYDDALDLLNAVADKDAMTLTMIGYATRKLGRTEEGIAIYHQALAIDPDNLNTHEYLGEGYLAAGRIDLAEAELDVLGRLCGTDCEQYRDLQKALLGEPVWN